MSTTPEALITLALLCLRGGKATDEQLEQDLDEFYAQYGEPTEESIRRWRDDHQTELQIGLAASKAIADRPHSENADWLNDLH